MPLQQDLQALLVLQTVDSRIDRAKSALAGLDTGAKIAGAYQTAKAEADAKQTAAHKAQTEQKDAEMRLTSIEAKTKDVNKSLYGGKITATRELENLQKELDMLARQKATQEDAVLEAMEAATVAAEADHESAQASEKLVTQYREIRAQYKSRHGELTAELAGLETARQTALAPLAANANLLMRYESIRKQKGGVAVAPVQDDGTCGACHTQLSGNLVDEIRAAKAVQLCEHCGRILTVPPPVPVAPS